MKTTEDTLLTAAPRWQAVGLLIDQNARDLQARRYGLLQDVVSWFKVIELFREAEFERLVEKTPTPADRRYHKTWLATLIAEGERLLTEIQASRGLARNAAGIRPSDVEATVEELYDTHAEWYGGIGPQQRKELLRQVFHGSPS